ncbi:hypothetical protein ACFE04_014883 [Oxalis oulophora]
MIINKNLPEDIVIDILLNLPVKALTRFACVSKPWYSLIKGDDTFIRKHHRLNAEHLLAVVKHYDSALDNVKDADPKLFPAVEDYTDFHGHCNGILCFYNSFYGKGILWNPSNRETRVLPMFPHGYTKQRKWCGLRLGFDERTDDYKVVVFSKLDDIFYHKTIWNADNDYVDYEYRFDIYSMRNDSWRRFKARAGLSVVVLERRHIIGGAAVTEEIIPGFKFSRCSYLQSLLRPSVISELELARHGLKLLRRSPSSFTACLDGRYLLLGPDKELNHSEIAKFSKRSDVRKPCEQQLEKFCEFMDPLLDSAPPESSSSQGMTSFSDRILIPLSSFSLQYSTIVIG